MLTAQNGREALEVARRFTGVIHCSLTDVRMPKMDGLALAEKLRNERPGIKVLLTSSSHLDQLDERCFLQKPFDIGVLRERLRQFLASPAV